MEEDELLRVLKTEQIVFARTSPQQKLVIVEVCFWRYILVMFYSQLFYRAVNFPLGLPEARLYHSRDGRRCE